ncbi:MAG: hypothetical protein H0X24_09615, partial [Ktedonobacterales bacterium]|nr:hypothetical protein [Ktedonobacterales bacterium]
DGQRLCIAPHGARKGQFQWHLDCPAAAIEVGLGAFNDITVHARLSSTFLHQHGYLAAWGLVADLWESWGITTYQPSEVHLYADVAGMAMDTLRRRDFVTRARITRWHVEDAHIIHLAGEKRDAERQAAGVQVIHRYGQQETLEFGRKVSAHACSIYDKPKEIRQHSPDKVWFADIWRRNGWNERDPVTRVEMRYKRALLHEMGIETMEDLWAMLRRMWAYSTQEWMRHTTPDGTPESQRWPLSRFWQVVQEATFLVGEVEPAARDKQRHFHEGRILSTIMGYLESWAAWHIGEDDAALGTLDIQRVLSDIGQRSAHHYEMKETNFRAAVRDKSVRIGQSMQKLADRQEAQRQAAGE